MANVSYRKLYPPIVEAKMNSFSFSQMEEDPKLYFDVSILNSIKDVNHMQISIFRADSNLNALQKYDYPLGIMFVRGQRNHLSGSLENQIFEDAETGKYYIYLPKNWITAANANQYYKLQIKLGEQVIAPIPNPQQKPEFHGMFHEVREDGTKVVINQKWLNTEENFLRISEWSTICMIKPITPPDFGLQGFDKNSDYPYSETDINAITSNSYNFIGYYSQAGNRKDEVLDTYSLSLYHVNLSNLTETLVEESGEKVVGEFNRASIQHTFNTILEDGEKYNVYFKVKSKSGYIGSQVYHAKVFYPKIEQGYTISVANQDMREALRNSAIKVSIKCDKVLDKVDNFILRRTSHRSNFKKWEDVAVFEVKNGLIFETSGNLTKFYEFYDKFVESGIMYVYGLQPAMGGRRGMMQIAKRMVNEIQFDVNGRPVETGNTIEVYHPIVVDYDYSWLIDEDEKQLNIAYNMNIGNYTKVVKESMVETIGGKFPFFTRNGNVDYVQFSLSGTITSHMDGDYEYLPRTHIVLDKEYEDQNIDIYNLMAYDLYLKENRIGTKDTYLIEREFRKVIERFLYDGKPKVLKTNTEGMLLGRLSAVSLTPKTELGRIIYDYSCTFTEVGEVTLENLMKYNIKKRIPVFVEIPKTELPYADQVYADQTKAF